MWQITAFVPWSRQPMHLTDTIGTPALSKRVRRASLLNALERAISFAPPY